MWGDPFAVDIEWHGVAPAGQCALMTLEDDLHPCGKWSVYVRPTGYKKATARFLVAWAPTVAAGTVLRLFRGSNEVATATVLAGAT